MLWVCIIRPSSAALSGRWPMVRWRHSMIARDRARSRRSPPRRRHGWCRWPAAKRRNWAMWQPYLRVIRERCTNAVNILDRFHIVAKMNEALDDVRAAEARRLVQDGYEPVLKKTRWCVLDRKANLTGLQRFRLRDLLRYNLKTVRAYLLKEDFQQFWEYHSPTWAAKFLDDWCQQVMRSRIEPMKKVAKTLLGHRELILNYFRAKKQFSSGVIEGLNNKAKLTMRKAYGFRTFRVIELALYHALGKLPEPNVAHRFY